MRLTAIGAILTALLCLCSRQAQQLTGSGTSPAVCGVKGRIVDAQGSPVAGVTVEIFSVNYIPAPRTAKIQAQSGITTDNQGNYEITPVFAGLYNISAEKDSLGVFIDSVTLAKDTGIVEMPVCTLSKSGEISGVVHLLGLNDTNQTQAILYIPGSGKAVRPCIGGAFTIAPVPAGTFHLVLTSDLKNYQALDTVVVQSDSTLLLDTIWVDTKKRTLVFLDSGNISVLWDTCIYCLRNSIQIPAGSTLTIMPGTEVLVMGDFAITNHGTFLCKGDSGAFVSFRHENPYETWQGIVSSENADSIYISNTILENALTGISIGNAGTQTIIERCVIRKAVTGLRLSSSSGGFLIRNNVMEGFPGTGGFLINIAAPVSQADSFACEFTNNIFFNSSYAVLEERDSAGGSFSSVFKNNCIHNLDSLCFRFTFGSDSTAVDTLTPFTPDTSGILHGDPQFVSTAIDDEDYHLKSGSLCIGTGADSTDMGVYSTYGQKDTL
jgi:hypothetical protein